MAKEVVIKLTQKQFKVLLADVELSAESAEGHGAWDGILARLRAATTSKVPNEGD